MKLDDLPAARIKLVGGRLCLDYVNTFGLRTEGVLEDDRLHSYVDLIAWAKHTGVLSTTRAQKLIRTMMGRTKAAEDAFRRAISFRESVYNVLEAILSRTTPGAADLEAVTQEVREARSRQRLVSRGTHIEWAIADDDDSFEQILWPIALSTEQLLTTGDLSRLHQCEGPRCGWIFEDKSKNRSRHWCDMKDCGNEAKVRRFRTRLKRASKGELLKGSQR